MNYNESLLFYLVVGLAVAVAYVATRRTESLVRLVPAIAGACLFWPLFLPLLLSLRSSEPADSGPLAIPRDDLAAMIDQVERELDAALASLDGWAENVLRRQPERLGELRAALVSQADRIRQMEALVQREALAERERMNHDAPTTSHAADAELPNERWQRARQARADNMLRLAGICRQSRADLMATLAWIRELVSMIHLAKFTGAPAARAEELVAQIATAIESVSSLSTDDAARPQKTPTSFAAFDCPSPNPHQELRT
jgi:hypothetical protein